MNGRVSPQQHLHPIILALYGKQLVIESVDSLSISRDGPDMPIYVIHNKSQKARPGYSFRFSKLYKRDLRLICYPVTPRTI